MTLWVDIGNSRIKLGTGSPGSINTLAAVAWREDSAADQLSALIAVHRPEHTVVSVVADDRPLALLNAALQAHGCTEATVHRQPTEDLLGLRCGYRDRAQLGVDRWFAVLGAWQQHRSAVCVVDLGTAGTADLVDATGQHLGGCIFAGVHTQRQALVSRTAHLPHADHQPHNVFNTTTETAIAAGTTLALAATVDRVWLEAERRIGGDVQCCLTGGGAPEVMPFLQRRVAHAPTLVLDGLAAAWAADQK